MFRMKSYQYKTSYLRKMLLVEKVSLVLLIPANLCFSLAAITHMWFELSGVHYGLWWAKFCQFPGNCQLVPAFFTNEPFCYHLLQVACLFAWGGLSLAAYMLLSTKMDHRIPKTLRSKRQIAISLICFMSVFAMSGALYLFYFILDEFPTQPKVLPELKWSSMLVGFACLLEFVAGILLLQA
ncbi:hypothetical protein CHS0354_014578 [Potamilus streckersoni]|uniref:Uncharacterized protein n=1 Tax=Potamilus streckersoni TaxID=2493646 RepID=A0AAE0VFK5_9BIVA|nr:hypothetical protein CHS0354_014578 [Potamilus streckersoni]